MTKPGLPGTRGRKRIYLMRHGEVSYRRPDGRTVFSTQVELTAEGIAQAEKMRAFLAQVPIDLGAHTGLTRTRQTAGLVLADRNVPLQEINALREIAAGSIGELSDERIDAEFTYGFERAAEPGAAFPGGESFADFQNRIVPAFEDFLRRPDWTTALLVGHGGTNAIILAWVTRGGLAGLSAFEQDAGCVNIIDADVIDGEIVRRMIRSVNLTPYNLPKLDHYLTVAERIVAGHREMRDRQKK
ncbi:MAG TPA: histidine phosphatase family protein [Burkholderiales bacterium]|nr:histidine phosphatase family protein [Burkholderiales bacterium]